MPKTDELKQYTKVAYKWSTANLSLLKGIGALIFGIALIYLSHPVIINLIVFSCGICLLYYGLKKLRLKKITNFIDKYIIEKLLNKIKF